MRNLEAIRIAIFEYRNVYESPKYENDTIDWHCPKLEFNYMGTNEVPWTTPNKKDRFVKWFITCKKEKPNPRHVEPNLTDFTPNPIKPTKAEIS